MPEPGLDQQLTSARTALLDAIGQPPLAEITARADRLRRRRHTRRAVAAAAVVLILVLLGVRPWRNQAEPVETATRPPQPGPTYAADGITINGLTSPVSALPDLPGRIADVEFTDQQHGYLLSADCTPICDVAYARTEDGGLTWQEKPYPAPVRLPTVPDLIPFPNGQLVLAADPPYLSSDGGQSWTLLSQAASTHLAGLAAGDMLRITAPNDSCPGGAPMVWSPARDAWGTLSATLPIEACWAAARPTADGAWWLGGVSQGGPALAVSRDLGRSWQRITLTAPGIGPVATVQVSALGSELYAVVLGKDRVIRAIFHSTNSGQTFTRTRLVPAGSQLAEPAALAGEAVPMLDGRLLVTTDSGRWYVSKDNGATFAEAIGNLPEVGPIRRTWAGYVAYDLFGKGPNTAGWTAFSLDGSLWHKLQIR